MHLPNFIIIGAQKCGTTTLYDILKDHPGIYMSDKKEVNFFTNPQKMKGGISKYSEYFKFANSNHSLIGEASPGYICYPGAAKSIKENLGGDLKLILILRDPIKRAQSQYWDNRRHLKESLTFEQTVAKYLTSEYNPNERGYFSRGVYLPFIEEYLKYFAKENLHIIILEDYIADPRKELNDLLIFLGLNDSNVNLNPSKASNSSLIWHNPLYNFFLKNPKYNSILPLHLRRLLFFGKQLPYKYPQPGNSVLVELNEFYKPWNDKLRRFLGNPLTKWS